MIWLCIIAVLLTGAALGMLGTVAYMEHDERPGKDEK